MMTHVTSQDSRTTPVSTCFKLTSGEGSLEASEPGPGEARIPTPITKAGLGGPGRLPVTRAPAAGLPALLLGAPWKSPGRKGWGCL